MLKLRVWPAPLLCALLLGSCGGAPSCNNEPLALSPNERGDKFAIVFSRNCGATTPNNVQISITNNLNRPAGTGNILIIDRATYSSKYKPVWINNNLVSISIPRGARIFLHRREMEGVHVVFR